jgi:hypothetical protein
MIMNTFFTLALASIVAAMPAAQAPAAGKPGMLPYSAKRYSLTIFLQCLLRPVLVPKRPRRLLSRQDFQEAGQDRGMVRHTEETWELLHQNPLVAPSSQNIIYGRNSQ